jgi:hypothetical protein
VGLVWPPKIKILYLSKIKIKNMNPTLIIGWLFLLAAWFPKSFIKDYQTRRGINLVLNSIAVGVFIGGIITTFTK